MQSAPSDWSFHSSPLFKAATTTDTNTAAAVATNISQRRSHDEGQPISSTSQQISTWGDFIVDGLRPNFLKWKLPVFGRNATLVKRSEDYQKLHNTNVGVFIDQPVHGANRITDSTKKQPPNWATLKAKAILIRMHMDEKYPVPVHVMAPDEVYKIHPEFQLHPSVHSKEDLKSLHAAVKREKEIVQGNEHD